MKVIDKNFKEEAPSEKKNLLDKVLDLVGGSSSNTPPPEEEEKVECVKKEFDPKNREVHLHQKGDKYQVLKNATGYCSKWISKKKAEEAFGQQINSTQNQ